MRVHMKSLEIACSGSSRLLFAAMTLVLAGCAAGPEPLRVAFEISLADGDGSKQQRERGALVTPRTEVETMLRSFCDTGCGGDPLGAPTEGPGTSISTFCPESPANVPAELTCKSSVLLVSSKTYVDFAAVKADADAIAKCFEGQKVWPECKGGLLFLRRVVLAR